MVSMILVGLLAVLLAVIMWYFVVGEERAEVGLTVPLVLINMPRDLIVVNNVPHGVPQALRVEIHPKRTLEPVAQTLKPTSGVGSCRIIRHRTSEIGY